MKKTLEGHKMFPYVAWATVVGFAFFTYTLAQDLKNDLNDLNVSVENLERSLNNAE